MVLSLMRKHAKSWLIKVTIGLIAIVFIFYFGFSPRGRKGVKVASVNGEPISEMEYDETYNRLFENLQRQYRDAWTEDLIKMLDIKNMALDSLVKQKLINQEARKIGLDVTEKEIQEEILAYPYFQTNGRFDERRYNAFLSQIRMSPEDFEASIAQQLVERKLTQFLMTFSSVTDQELLDDYTFDNEKVMISFVQFLPKDFESSVVYEPKALEDYFGEHKEEYRMPEKIQIAFITIDPNAFKEEVLVSDEDVKDYYEQNINAYREEKQVKARHILFRLEENATEEEEEKVRERALSVLEKAQGGDDFAELAKEYSEGPTGEKGGDLGYFSSGQMVKPFEEAAFGMEKDQISDLVRTRFGYHIIKAEDIKEGGTKGLSEVQGQIKNTLLNISIGDLAHEKALSLIDQMPYEGVVLSEYAKAHQVPIEQSDYFSSNETIPGIGGDASLRNAIFSLQKNDVSGLLEFREKYYIVQLIDKKASYLPELKDVEDQVTKDFISHLATLEARAAAESYLEGLRGGKSWDELATEQDLSPQKSEFFTRNDSIAQTAYAPDFRETVFGLGEDKRHPDEVFENDKGIFVIRWEEREGIDMEKYKEEQEELRTSFVREKQQTVLDAWLESLKNRAEIERIDL
jgi:peptidyl-prolyl cis-trans isomerase D